MPKLPVASGKETIQALRRAGLLQDHQEGSHITMIDPSTRRRVTVTVHGNKDLKPGVMRAIIRQAGLSVEEFRALLK